MEPADVVTASPPCSWGRRKRLRVRRVRRRSVAAGGGGAALLREGERWPHCAGGVTGAAGGRWGWGVHAGPLLGRAGGILRAPRGYGSVLEGRGAVGHFRCPGPRAGWAGTDGGEEGVGDAGASVRAVTPCGQGGFALRLSLLKLSCCASIKPFP